MNSFRKIINYVHFHREALQVVSFIHWAHVHKSPEPDVSINIDINLFTHAYLPLQEFYSNDQI